MFVVTTNLTTYDSKRLTSTQTLQKNVFLLQALIFSDINHLGANDSLSEVGHETDQRRVPLVGDLGERRASRRHQHLTDTVLERPDRRIVHSQEGLFQRQEAGERAGRGVYNRT